MSNLRAEVRSSLPTKVLDLWDTLEDFASLEIDVLRYSDEMKARMRSLPAAVMVSHRSAKFFLPETEPLTAQAVYHELQHIHRAWVEMVPELDLVEEDPTRRGMCGEIESHLEHLVIYPRQIEADLDEPERRKANQRKACAGYPWPERKDPWNRRYHCLILWLFADFDGDPEIVEWTRRVVLAEGHLREAEQFKKRVQEMLNNKPKLISCAIRFLKIPRSDVRMRAYDVRNRRKILSPIPAH